MKQTSSRLVTSCARAAGWTFVGSATFPFIAALPVCLWALFAGAPVPLTFAERIFDAAVSIPIVAAMVAAFEVPGAVVGWLLLVSATMLYRKEPNGGFPFSVVALGIMLTSLALIVAGETAVVQRAAAAVEVAPAAPVLLPLGFVGVLCSPLLFKVRRRRVRALLRLNRILHAGGGSDRR